MKEGRLTFEQVCSLIGQVIGVSEWHVVDQKMIDQFAVCTGDDQWIHIDQDRARRESPLRTTIAHGYLSLSLLTALAVEAGAIPRDTQAAFNVGLDKVRFMTPVKSGARVRLHVRLLSVEQRGPGQYLMRAENTMEIEGELMPALSAETMVMFYERRRKPRPDERRKSQSGADGVKLSAS